MKDKKDKQDKDRADSVEKLLTELEALLPQSSKLLREKFDEQKKLLKDNAPRAKDDAESWLEFEALKNDCLLELLQLAIEQYQRVSADYANFQRRVPKQVSDSIAYEKENIIRSVLPILDNFEHTLEKSHSAESIDAIIQGVKIIYDQMVDMLKSHGVEQVSALDEKFDPSMHEAMMRRSEPEREDNTVLEEFRKGYKLNDRIIRPSKVVVNKLETEQINKAETDQDFNESNPPSEPEVDYEA
jgi:molecular chaperone GrpE